MVKILPLVPPAAYALALCCATHNIPALPHPESDPLAPHEHEAEGPEPKAFAMAAISTTTTVSSALIFFNPVLNLTGEGDYQTTPPITVAESPLKVAAVFSNPPKITSS